MDENIHVEYTDWHQNTYMYGFPLSSAFLVYLFSSVAKVANYMLYMDRDQTAPKQSNQNSYYLHFAAMIKYSLKCTWIHAVDDTYMTTF